MPTREEILKDLARRRVLQDLEQRRAARPKPEANLESMSKALAAARLEGAPPEKIKILEGAVDRFREPIGQELPEAAEPKFIPIPMSREDEFNIERVAKERAEGTVERRNLPISETQALIDMEKAKEREQRARTVSVGGGVDPARKAVLPILRPTRIQEYPTFTPPLAEPTGSTVGYLDPDTGVVRAPTTFERAVEATARQPVMSEPEALAFAAERDETRTPENRSALKNVLTQRVPGEGIVETPLGATLRTVGTLTPSFVSTALIGPLLGASGVETTRGQPVGFGADPQGKRGVDETLDFMDQWAQGVAKGRGVGDELAQITPLVKKVAEAAGENEEWARNALWGVGTLTEFVQPVTPVGLVGQAGKAVGLGSKAAKGAGRAVVGIAPDAAKGALRGVGEAVSFGPKVVNEAGDILASKVGGGVRDRALLGTIAKRTFPEAADRIPRLGSEDDVVRAVVESTSIKNPDEVRTVLRSQVPDDLVQISPSTASSKVLASQNLEEARAAVRPQVESAKQAGAPLTPAQVEGLIDDYLVAKAGKSGVRLLDELSVRSLSPTPAGAKPSLFDSVVARTFAAAWKDLSPGGAVRPDNALAASLYEQIRNSSFRATADLRDDILQMAKEIPQEDAMGVKIGRQEAKNELLYRIYEKHIAKDPEGFEKLLDKVIEDGLGKVGGVDVKRAAKEAASRFYRLRASITAASMTPQAEWRLVRATLDRVAEDLGIKTESALAKSIDDRLLPIMAATIVEDIVKPSIVGERGSTLAELSQLQRGRPARAGDVTVGGAQINPRSTTGQQWASGLDSAFKPADMFDPAALNAALTDSVATVLEGGLTARKRLTLYLASQFGPIPNAPAWLDRFIRGAAISASQIGFARTGQAAADAIRYSLAAPDAVLFTDRAGTAWTKAMITEEGRRLGLGLSSQDMARQGAANRILIDRVQRVLDQRKGVGSASSIPGRLARKAIGPDYPAMASAASDAYREAVFAGALKSGETPQRAAVIARRSLLDYTKTNDVITSQITSYFASAAETYEGLASLADTLIRQPELPVLAVKMQNGLDRMSDPYGLQSDAERRALYSLRIPTADQPYQVLVGANPVVWGIESVLGSLGMVDAGYGTVRDVASGAETLSGGALKLGEAGLRLGGAVLLGDLEPSQPSTVEAPKVGKLSENEMLGLLLYASDAQGPHPEWRPMIDANFPRAVVSPPKELAVPGPYGAGRIWLSLPADWREKGLVWERIGAAEAQGYPEELREAVSRGVRAYKPEPEAKNLLRGLRGILPQVAQRGLRTLASDAASNYLDLSVGVPASEGSPSRAAVEALTGRGTAAEGEALMQAVEALRATRAGE